MANVFVNPQKVAKESVRMLENELMLARKVHRQYVREWNGDDKIGGSVTIKAPMYARVKDGAVIDTVDLVERSFTLTVDQRKHVAHVITAQEMTLNFDEFSERFIRPAMEGLANYIESAGFALYSQLYNQVGTPGTTPASYYLFAQAAQRLTEEGCPKGDRACFMNPAATAKMSDVMKNLFHRELVGDAIKRGRIPPLGGMDTFESNNIAVHTAGTWGADAPQVNDTVAEGDTDIDIDTMSIGATAKEGDIFTIANVEANNPISGASYGANRQFAVQGDVVADGSGEVAGLTINPGTAPYNIYSNAANETYLPYQNVVTLPANDAVITPVGSTGQVYPVNMAIHKNAMALVTLPIRIPASTNWGARSNHKGISLRVIRFYDGINDQEYVRWDVLYGWAILNAALGCRIAG